jgi:hypothetical protein
VARNDVVWRLRKLPQLLIAFEHFLDVVEHRKYAVLFHMRVEVAGVGGEHDMPAPRLHAHALQTFGVAADFVNGNAGRNLAVAVMKFDAAVKDPAQHRAHVVEFERDPHMRVTHAAAGRKSHLGVLQMITRARKQRVIADMIVMHVAHDHVAHRIRIDAERFQSLAHRLYNLTVAGLRARLVET